MHGQRTLKQLNDNAVAQAIMAAKPVKEFDEKLDAAFKEAMAKRAQEAAAK